MSYTKTTEKRNELKKILDSFSTFQLGGTQDMFDKYGIFIIDSGNSGLKFYNGPSFSNEYSSPQFSKNRGSLLGVNFNGLTISFTCGVYWFSIGEYRKLLEELNPLKTTYLVFDFNKDYRYNVKLAKCDNSTRYIIGYEGKEPRYYTELSLSFDIQGDACAIGTHPYEFGYDNTPNKQWKKVNNIFTTQIIKTNEFVENDIYTPIEIPLAFKCIGNSTDEDKNIYHEIKLEAIYNTTEKKTINGVEQEIPKKDTITLFNVELQNLTLNTDSTQAVMLNLRYVSENGLLFLQYGNSNEKLLNLLNTTDTGEKIVKSSTVNKFLIPGSISISNSDFTVKDIIFQLSISKYDDNNDNLSVPDGFFDIDSAAEIICYPRTNVI